MGEGPYHFDFLQGHCNRFGLVLPDPDRQVTIHAHLPQNDESLRRHEVHPHTVYGHFYPFLAPMFSILSHALPQGTFEHI